MRRATDLQISAFARWSGRNPLSTTEAVAFSIPTARRRLSRWRAARNAYSWRRRQAVQHIQPPVHNPCDHCARNDRGAVDESWRPGHQPGDRQLSSGRVRQIISGPGTLPADLLLRLFAIRIDGDLRNAGTISPFGSINAQSLKAIQTTTR